MQYDRIYTQIIRLLAQLPQAKTGKKKLWGSTPPPPPRDQEHHEKASEFLEGTVTDAQKKVSHGDELMCFMNKKGWTLNRGIADLDA